MNSSGLTLRERLTVLPWFAIIMTVIIIGFLSVVIYAVAVDIIDYRNQCHNVGGHIITVRTNDVCVDHDGKIILV